MRGFCRGGRCWDDGWGLVDDARCSLFGGDEPFDGFERNAKKEEERDGVEDDVDGVCGLLGGVGDMVEEETLSSSLWPDEDGVVTPERRLCLANDLSTPRRFRSSALSHSQ